MDGVAPLPQELAPHGQSKEGGRDAGRKGVGEGIGEECLTAPSFGHAFAMGHVAGPGQLAPRLCHVAGPGQASFLPRRAAGPGPYTHRRRHVTGRASATSQGAFAMSQVTADRMLRAYMAHLDLQAHGSNDKVANGPRHTPFRAFRVP